MTTTVIPEVEQPDPNFIEVIEQTPGLTYRQADHWIRKGYISARCAGHAIGHGLIKPCDKGGGYGHHRYIDDDEVAVLRIMARLVNAGLHPEVAAHMARNRTRLTVAVLRGLERLQPKGES